MELVLTRQPANGSQVAVTCDGQPSHTFDLRTLIPNDRRQPPHPLEDPVAYGSAVYAALFPPATLTRREFEKAPDRILLVTTDNELDAVPWEYVHGSYGPADPSHAAGVGGFLVLECHFVRGLTADKRIAPPKLERNPHIIAIPSNPLSQAVEPLNIEDEWLRLREAIQDKTLQGYAITLERTRPPTLERLGLLVANQRHRIVHFMGHGGLDEKKGTILCFEKDNGDLDVVSAKEFTSQIRDTVFLVTLNACASATPGEETQFSNLAAALARQKTPYALGMRFSIPDDDALTLSRTFYSYLIRGSSVEEAVYRVRLALARNEHRPWLVGMPVLYTALSAPATGFPSVKGAPEIEEHQPRIEATALPRAEGTFQGRADELRALGMALTDDSRPPIITIHGTGGQGKTALAREAVERFAFAWPGGVWATSLENLPSRELFVNDLARFLGIDTQTIAEPNEVERLVIAHLAHRRTLIVLDNTESLVEAVEANNEEAIRLAQFLREQVPRPPASFLATSRAFLGWAGEMGCELTGLTLIAGIKLFQQHAPRRESELDRVLVWRLSKKIEGHPLSLLLLGRAFDTSAIHLSAFVEEYEEQLLNAENKYKDVDHRQRTLFTSIETSVRYLDEPHRHLLSGLWLFHAPFLPETAAEIFDPQAEPPTEGKEPERQRSPIYDRLHTLWGRGLLLRETLTVREGTFLFYRLPPTMRPYVEQFLAHTDEREILLASFGTAYARLVDYLYGELDRGGLAAALTLLLREDLERGASCVTGVEQGYYWLCWGWILQRLGYRKSGLEFTEQALQVGQEQNQGLKLNALNNMAGVYTSIGQPEQALKLYEQALLLRRELGDRAGEATTLNGLAGVYTSIGQPEQALKLYEQALPLRRELGDRAGEAVTLSNMAEVYRQIGQPEQALKLHEQALLLTRELGDRAGEATSLNNVAMVYADTGQPEQALKLYEQALPLIREVGDRAGEAATLNNMAEVYRQIGQPEQALKLYEQALPLIREVGDRVREATILSSMEVVYQRTRQPQQALKLYEQALPLRRELGDRVGEAVTLSNMAEVYRQIGQPEQALKLHEQALLLIRELGDRAGEAATLHNVATAYADTGQPEQALKLYEQALPLRRELGDRAGEAVTLSNMAEVYRQIGQPEQALKLHEQALPLTRELGDRAEEATILSSMAVVYQRTRQPQQALKLYEQALPLIREVGDRYSEANTLNNMAGVYVSTGQPEQALKLYEQALPLIREVGDRVGEAATLNGLAYNYQVLQRYAEAQTAFEQSIALAQQVSHRADESAGLVGMALLLYEYLDRPQEAIAKMEQALAVLIATGLPQDAAGTTKERMQQYLHTMRQGVKLGPATNTSTTMPDTQVQQMITNTIAVMRVAQEHRTEWREVITIVLKDAQQQGSNRQIDVDFFSAVLDILDGKPRTLPADHPYAQAIASIQSGITAEDPEIVIISDELVQAVRDFVNTENWEAKRHIVEMRQAILFRSEVDILFERNIERAQASGNERLAEILELHLSIVLLCKTHGIAATFEQIEAAQQAAEELANLPFDRELITRSIQALAGGAQERMQHMQYLAAQASQTSDEGLKALINAIQLALFGGSRTQLGQDLEGVYRQAWDAIVGGVERAGGTAS